MSDANKDNVFKKELDKSIELFKQRVLEEKDKEFEKRGPIMKSSPTFPLFPVFNEYFYRQDYYEKKINDFLYNILIKDFLTNALKAEGYDCEKIEKTERWTRSKDNMSLSLPVDCVFDFIIYDNKTGYIFEDKIEKGYSIYVQIKLDDYNSKVDITDDLLESSALICGLSRIVHISFSSQNYCNKENFSSDKVEVLSASIESFFDELFDKNKFELYKSEVRKAIEFANETISFINMPSYKGKYLIDFRKATEKRLLAEDYDNLKFVAFDKTNSEETGLESYSSILISKKIKDNFIGNGLYRSLFGNSSFAKSFMTAEYLIENLGDAHNFDFSSIASCYFKTIEQLLLKIVFLSMINENLNTNNSITDETDKDVYYIKRNNIRINRNKYESLKRNKYIDIQQSDNVTIETIALCNQFERYFDLSLGPLRNFIIQNYKNNHLNATALDTSVMYNINSQDKNEIDILDECLDVFTSYRNYYLHKKIMNSESGFIKDLRKNTIFLCAVLLGSAKINTTLELALDYFDVVNDSFDNLISFLSRTAINRKLIIEYPSGEKCDVVLVKDTKKEREFDENGFAIKTPLYFVKINKNWNIVSCLEYAEKASNKDRIILSRTNYPIRVWSIELGKETLVYEIKK